MGSGIQRIRITPMLTPGKPVNPRNVAHKAPGQRRLRCGSVRRWSARTAECLPRRPSACPTVFVRRCARVRCGSPTVSVAVSRLLEHLVRPGLRWRTEDRPLPVVLAVDRVEPAGEPHAHRMAGVPRWSASPRRRRSLSPAAADPDRSNADATGIGSAGLRWARSLNTCWLLRRTSMRVLAVRCHQPDALDDVTGSAPSTSGPVMKK